MPSLLAFSACAVFDRFICFRALDTISLDHPSHLSQQFPLSREPYHLPHAAAPVAQSDGIKNSGSRPQGIFCCDRFCHRPQQRFGVCICDHNIDRTMHGHEEQAIPLKITMRLGECFRRIKNRFLSQDNRASENLSMQLEPSGKRSINVGHRGDIQAYSVWVSNHNSANPVMMTVALGRRAVKA